MYKTQIKPHQSRGEPCPLAIPHYVLGTALCLRVPVSLGEVQS